ncbi:radical SAM protein, partial [Metapseudomonas otitidis]
MEYQKLNFSRLVLEITRKCNLKCAHCLRGDAQDISMSTKIIDQVIPQINAALSLSLTGGEPMLAPEVIEHLTASVICNNIFVGRVGMICNGTILDERAIRSIKAFN